MKGPAKRSEEGLNGRWQITRFRVSAPPFSPKNACLFQVSVRITSLLIGYPVAEIFKKSNCRCGNEYLRFLFLILENVNQVAGQMKPGSDNFVLTG